MVKSIYIECVDRGAISESINVASSSSFRLRSMDTMNVIKWVHWMNKVHEIDMSRSIETIGRLLAIPSSANSRDGGIQHRFRRN
jgi:hypothetical protein